MKQTNKSYFHATPYENLLSIVDNGIKTGCDRVIYVADNPTSAAMFLAVRGCKDILVVEVKLPSSKLVESFDHSEAFFRCRAFTYDKPISTKHIKNYTRYDLTKRGV